MSGESRYRNIDGVQCDYLSGMKEEEEEEEDE
jgi:hypothetical protein